MHSTDVSIQAAQLSEHARTLLAREGLLHSDVDFMDTGYVRSKVAFLRERLLA